MEADLELIARRLGSIEHKIDRVLEHVLASIPRLRSSWPNRLSTRAKNVVSRNNITIQDVQQFGDAKLRQLRNCGPRTMEELLDAAREKEEP